MPLVNVDLLRYLITLRGGFNTVVPYPKQRPEPLHAVYHRSCLPQIEAQIQQGDKQISHLYDHLRVRNVPDSDIRVHDPHLRSFMNANTPAELAAIEALL
jgi:molybdopterin-guanine dinucleotide biosynthesis protein A